MPRGIRLARLARVGLHLAPGRRPRIEGVPAQGEVVQTAVIALSPDAETTGVWANAGDAPVVVLGATNLADANVRVADVAVKAGETKPMALIVPSGGTCEITASANNQPSGAIVLQYCEVEG